MTNSNATPPPCYAHLAPGLAVARTVEVTDSVMVDVDAEGRLIGVETLDGSDWTGALVGLAISGRLRIPPNDQDEHLARRAQLIEEFGEPEHISEADAAALAAAAGIRIEGGPTVDEIVSHIYRDDTAADGWLESNRIHNGHPTLAKVPLPDGRVVGILDLRPALERAREES